MASEDSREVINTKIWFEEADEDNPFAAEACYCAGFDVFGELIDEVSFIDYLFLLFQLDPPSPLQQRLLNKIAVALANPGPRDLSVRAAMAAAVGGSTAGSSLMGAISAGAGKFTGAREVFLCTRQWSTFETDLDRWLNSLNKKEFDTSTPEVWPKMEHAPGFDPHTDTTTKPVRQLLQSLCGDYAGGALGFLSSHLAQLQAAAGCGLGLTGVAAAAFVDIGFNDEQAEMLYLLLRLPGAAAHAVEQRQYGARRYPYFGQSLTVTNWPPSGS